MSHPAVVFPLGRSFLAALVLTLAIPTTARAQQAQSERQPGQFPPAPATAAPLYTLEDGFLRWPLPPGAERYGAIEGRAIHRYVVEQAEISRRYRDHGHPQFWGRITGTESDQESQRWLTDHFRRIGLSDVHTVTHELAPQWIPDSWQVSVSGSGVNKVLESAQPIYETPDTPPDGLDLEAVYVGTGSEADFIGRDVRGKAAFIFSMPMPGGTRPGANQEGATMRAAQKGAAAVFLIIAQPGNMKTQLYPVNTQVPSFAVGMQDGYLVRDLAGMSPAQAPRVRIQLQTRRVPNLTTGTVMATLPGRSDETVWVIAHRDGWFDAAGDNAGGVAAMIALAEFYAKTPQAERPRTLVFAGVSGHHNSANKSMEWLTENRATLFGKTALVINSEHPSTLQTYLNWHRVRAANTYTAQYWYAGGPTRPQLQSIAVAALRDFGVPTYAEPETRGPPGDLSTFCRYVPGFATSDFNMYFHMDAETPETVPWTGLEASTRAYAKVIDEVNKLPLSAFQRPESTSC
jgi:hypothetical protein